jgi:hypothetical protein
MVEMFKRRFADDESKTLLIQYLCKDGEGCQADYVHTWGGYLGGAFLYDIPLTVVGLLVIFGQHNILHDVFSNIFTWLPFAVDMIFVAVGVLVTIGTLTTTGIPFFISSVAFCFSGYYLWHIR